MKGSISFVQGKGSIMHNKREYDKYDRPLPDNIDSSRAVENIWVVDRDLKEVYDENFGEAIEKYNSKQTRKDRKITNYMDKIEKSKNGERVFYEDIIQFGDKDLFEQHPEARETAKKCLIDYCKGFKERNPNLAVVGMYIHMDEKSPHLHLDYVPVAHGYTKGLEARNSLDKALKEQGIEIDKGADEGRYNNVTKAWKDRERKAFKQICQEHGLEVAEEQPSHRPYLTPQRYREEAEKERETIETDIAILEQRKDTYQEGIEVSKAQYEEAVQQADKGLKWAQKAQEEPIKTSIGGTVKIPENDYRTLLTTVNAVKDLKESQNVVKDKMYELSMKEHKLDKREKNIANKERTLEYYEQDLKKAITDNKEFSNKVLEEIKKHNPKLAEFVQKVMQKVVNQLKEQAHNLTQERTKAFEDLDNFEDLER